MVKEAYEKYKLSSSTLEKCIEIDYGNHIYHNKIHRILLDLGYSKSKNKKDIRKKEWIRYVRRHSLTAFHIDRYYYPLTQEWVFAVIDYASRKLLALIECKSPTTDASIDGMIEALKHGKIKQCICDHGSQFISNMSGDSRFIEFLEKKGIKQILCRIKHPQSNGKVEKFFDLYQNKRILFKSKENFIVGYNEIRPHRSIDFEVLETPQQAVERKMKAEV